MTLFFFGVQVVTGILLLLYYRPSAAEAYESVQFIMTRVPFGWLVRSIHAWSANLMIGAAFAHLFSVIFLHAYRQPRELTWCQRRAAAFPHASRSASAATCCRGTSWRSSRRASAPTSRAWCRSSATRSCRFLRGGKDVTGATLTRFFGVHVAILPAITTALLGLHLVLVQYHGMSVPPSRRSAREARPASPCRRMPFAPHFVLRDLFGWTVALALLAALSAFLPWELGTKADPFAAAPAGIRPEWYFLWMFQALKYVPATSSGIEGELVRRWCRSTSAPSRWSCCRSSIATRGARGAWSTWARDRAR